MTTIEAPEQSAENAAADPGRRGSTIKLTCAFILATALAVALAACGSQSNAAQTGASGRAPARSENGGASTAARTGRVSSAPRVTSPGQPGQTWKPVASVGGRVAGWIAQRSGVTLLRFDQSMVHLALHAGSSEPEGGGWAYGDHIGAGEVHRVVAAFNGGFKLSYGSVGFVSGGRVAVALTAGLGSIVTYGNGTTEIGAWHQGVPARGLKIASVLQNLHLLVDHGLVASNASSCVNACWGSTLGGGADVARSALGISSEGQLVWAAGESLSPAMIGQALVNAGVTRAVELDINPEWVAGYLYLHHPGGPNAVPVIPGQLGIPGKLLAPYSRDFFTVVAN
jgi:hypothetical protein